jgi:hypothetical protein
MLNRAKGLVFSSLWAARRRLGMAPMARLVKELKRRQVDLGTLRALEAFGGTGVLQTVDYAGEVASLEVWEIHPGNEEALRRNLPGARIKIVDSYREIQTTAEQFDFIVVDAPAVTHGGEHLEHFDLFPSLLRVAGPSALIVLSVMDRVRRGQKWLGAPGLPREEYLARRARFYRTSKPATIAVDDMIPAYRDLIADHGFRLDWHLVQPKWRIFKYLALKVSRKQ